jgi:hypothetical protein
VWIERDCDHERALIVLREIEAAGARVGSHACSACGEESPVTFDLCWNCGGTLPAAV